MAPRHASTATAVRPAAKRRLALQAETQRRASGRRSRWWCPCRRRHAWRWRSALILASSMSTLYSGILIDSRTRCCHSTEEYEGRPAASGWADRFRRELLALAIGMAAPAPRNGQLSILQAAVGAHRCAERTTNVVWRAIRARGRESHRLRRSDCRSGRARQVRHIRRNAWVEMRGDTKRCSASPRRLAAAGANRSGATRGASTQEKSGRDLNRRISKNELSAIQVLPPSSTPSASILREIGMAMAVLRRAALFSERARRMDLLGKAGGEPEARSVRWRLPRAVKATSGKAASPRPTTVTTTRFSWPRARMPGWSVQLSRAGHMISEFAVIAWPASTGRRAS